MSLFRFQGDRACAPLSPAWRAAQARIETCVGWDWLDASVAGQ